MHTIFFGGTVSYMQLHMVKGNYLSYTLHLYYNSSANIYNIPKICWIGLYETEVVQNGHFFALFCFLSTWKQQTKFLFDHNGAREISNTQLLLSPVNYHITVLCFLPQC